MYIYISTHFLTSQPTLIKLDNENIGGHLTPLQASRSNYRVYLNVLKHLGYYLFIITLKQQWCERDQILKTKTKTAWAFVPRLFVQYTYCPSSKQFPFSVFKRLLYLTYSKFNSTVLTIRTTELHVGLCSLRINIPDILQRIRMHSLS